MEIGAAKGHAVLRIISSYHKKESLLASVLQMSKTAA